MKCLTKQMTILVKTLATVMHMLTIINMVKKLPLKLDSKLKHINTIN